MLLPGDIPEDLRPEDTVILTSYAVSVRYYIVPIAAVNVWAEIVYDVVRENRQNAGILYN